MGSGTSPGARWVPEGAQGAPGREKERKRGEVPPHPPAEGPVLALFWKKRGPKSERFSEGVSVTFLGKMGSKIEQKFRFFGDGGHG